MASEFYGFFDSAVGDIRSYSADNMAAMFRLISTDGVRSLGTNLQVIPNGGDMQVRILPGAALVQGYQYWLIGDGGSPLTRSLSTGGANTRIDRVVLKLDVSGQYRLIQLYIKPGIPSANPVPPALNQPSLDGSDHIYEISLAQVRVDAGASIIDETTIIVDERADETVCGLATPYALKLSTIGATHTHNIVLTGEGAKPGFMSVADKTKLDDRLGQPVNTTSAPTFAGATFNGNVDMTGKKIQNAVFE
jgi:hypothetical protein